MQSITDIPVQLTPGAIAEFKRLMATDASAQGKVLRIGVKGGGCTGMSYVLNFDDKKAGDEEYDVEGVPVVMEPSHEMYLYGMEVDYQNGLNSRGFTFKNPNASKTCGCGSSFAV